MTANLTPTATAATTAHFTTPNFTTPNSTSTNVTASTHFPTSFDLAPHYSQAYKIVSSTILFAIMSMAIFGNTLVIVAFRKYHKLRTVTNYFLVSLAVSDILISATSLPIWAAHIVTGPDQEWKKIDPLAKVVWIFFDIVCGLASIYNLTCISIERYICLSSPLRYYERLSGRKALIIILLIWFISSIMAAARIVFKDTKRVFEIGFPIIAFFIPLAIMVVMYSMIFRVACKQVKKMDIPMNGKTKKFRLHKEIKAAKTLGIVISAFFVCWSPFFILNFLAICPKCYKNISINIIIAAKWFHFINSVLNPLIYARMNKDFRDGFTRILLQCAMSVGVRENANESDLPPHDRRSSSVFGTVGKRRKSSSALHASDA